MVKFCSLASGSNGNCLYLGQDGHGILVDAGVSCRAILRGLDEIGVAPGSIDAIFVTHEHSDHVAGLRVLLKHLQRPVFATAEVLGYLADHCGLPAGARLCEMPVFGVEAAGMIVGAFDTAHDSLHSVGYLAITREEKRIGIATDLGRVTPAVSSALAGADLVLLESNYDREMLMNGRYTYALKKRIDSGTGHLSNDDSAEMLVRLAQSGVRRFLLGHLSAENNLPRLARQTALDRLAAAGFVQGTDYWLDLAPRGRVGTPVEL